MKSNILDIIEYRDKICWLGKLSLTVIAHVRSVWTFNYNLILTKRFTFNISILQQAMSKIVYIYFSVTAFCYSIILQNNFKRYNLYQGIRICDLFFISITFSLI